MEKLDDVIGDLQAGFEQESVVPVNVKFLAFQETISYFLAQLLSPWITTTIFPFQDDSTIEQQFESRSRERQTAFSNIYEHPSRIIEDHVLSTIDGNEIQVSYVPPIGNRGVVILYHANCMTGRNWENTFEFDFLANELGLGVIMPTIRAYSNASSMDKNFNRSLLFDTEAVVNFLLNMQNIPKDKIVSFGFSLGGAYAATTAHYFRTPLILQNAWQNLQTMVSDHLGSSGYYASIFQHYENEDFFDFDGDLRAYTQFGYTFDRFDQDFGNNIRKLRLENTQPDAIDVMIIFARDDEMMGGADGAWNLYNARYPNKKRIDYQRFVGVDGGHLHQFARSEYSKYQVKNFLLQNGIIL